MALQKLLSSEEFNQAVNEKDVVFVLKNSTTCPISQAAFDEYEKFANDHEGIPFYYLNVQDARPLSNEIAETYKVKHESPQVLLFKNNQVIWHDSHWNITYSKLGKAKEEKIG
ncbi:bacillithiol system redox-active protein YtxJ [Fictibacillus sp. Mic-4]|uniref:bacillithiol system redox-active protein YtxJ n=1 Tax=Fictibacillus sp. Mic-4 TaxID=3132826 RepID=UPI003CF77498